MIKSLALLTFSFFLFSSPLSLNAQKAGALKKGQKKGPKKINKKVKKKSKKTAKLYRGKRLVIGKTFRKRKIYLYRYGYADKKIVFLIAGMHGNEKLAIKMMKNLKRDLDRNRKLIPKHIQLWVLPVHNVDGARKGERLNARNVDINRNFGTKNWQRATRVNNKRFPRGGGRKPFSEPESRALRWIFEKYKKKIPLVINVHCCGRVVTAQKKSPFAMKLEAEFLKHVKYRTLKKSWSQAAYPVTGSFAQWHWEKFKIPDLFIELDKYENRPYKELKKSIFAVLNHKSLRK